VERKAFYSDSCIFCEVKHWTVDENLIVLCRYLLLRCRYGQLSGLVEPIGAIIGATATTMVRGLLPYSLGFAAGAMIYVVIAELIPETHAKGKQAATITNYGFLFGFLLMMVLDVALG